MLGTGMSVLVKKLAINLPYGSVLYFVFEKVGVDPIYIVLIMLMMLADILTGMGRAVVMERKITSKDMRNGVIRRMSILLLIFAVGIVFGRGFALWGYPEIGIHLIKIGVSCFIVTELYSVTGNVGSMVLDKDIDEQAATKMLISFLLNSLGVLIRFMRNKGRALLNKFIKDD